MLRTLRIEWMKVKNYRTFWILMAISVVSIPAFNYTFYNLFDNKFPKIKGQSVLGSPFAFPDVWQTIGWNAGLLFIIPAILIITLTTNEFTFKTHRQNVIDGWSRGQFIQVKIVEVVLLALVCSIVVLITGLCFGFLGNKVAAGVYWWQDIRFVFFYFVQALSYGLIAFLMAMLIRRAGLALGVFLIYMLLENIIVGIVHNIYKSDVANYMPEEVTDQLIPWPYLKGVLMPQGAAWEKHVPGYLIVAGVYVIIYCVIITRRFRRSDL